MATFRIHRLKPVPREQFRWAAHTGGEAIIKPKDYEPAETVDGHTVYAAWQAMNDANEPLAPGDLLESESGELKILKYIGFESAKWFVPELKAPTSDIASGMNTPAIDAESASIANHTTNQ